MERWCGRVAIVTGAGSGNGAAIARALVENGLKVVGVDINLQGVQTLAEELKSCKGELKAIQGDVTKDEDVIRVVKWTRDNLGGVDVLVNNAGVAPLIALTDFNTKHLRKTMDTNVLGLCLFTREAVKDMKDRKLDDGHIFHINSMLGHFMPNSPGLYFYQSTKHAVTVLTEGLRRELRDLGTKIRVTSISPGLVRTNIFSSMGEEREKKFMSNNPLLEPVDVANALVYALASPPHVQVHEIILKPVGEKY